MSEAHQARVTTNHFYCVTNDSLLSLGLHPYTIHWEHIQHLEKYSDIFQQLKTIKISSSPLFLSFQNKMKFSPSQRNRDISLLYSAECMSTFRNVLQCLLLIFGYVLT